MGKLRLPSAMIDLLALAPSLRVRAAHLHEGGGRLSRAAGLVAGDPSPYGRRLAELTRALSDGGLPFPPPADAASTFTGRAVMALHASPPHMSNGYTVRTLALLDGLRQAGIDCAAVTRPNFPNDLAAFSHVPPTDLDETQGHAFHRLSSDAPLWEGPLSDYIYAFADGLVEHARRKRAGVVHAASNHVCGLAGCLAAERVGARAVYELRGLWHWSSVNRRPGWELTETFALHEALERQAALRAQRVVVLSEALAGHARGWGVDPARIVVAPNGVDAAAFAPAPRDMSLRAAWGASPTTFVAGFVGTFTAYEGLDTLLAAVALLRQRGVDAMAVLVGDGEDAECLKGLARKLAVPVTFPGRIPFAQVPATLSAMDCCPFPRRAEGATLLVPPLKLAEAMACGVPVAVADIPPLTEIVDHRRTGLVFSPGVNALADTLDTLRRDPDTAQALAREAREWVVAHRTWDAVTRLLLSAWKD